MSNLVLAASEDSGYNIQRSLRFRSSASAYLNRTPASNGNSQKWTWSGWIKRGTLGSNDFIYGANNVSYNFDWISFGYLGAADGLEITFYRNSTTKYGHGISSAVFRDPSAWYFIVVAVDTTQATDTNRVKFYVNGVQYSTTALGNGYIPQNTATYFNTASIPTYVGARAGTGFLDGYLAEVNFIDGQALTPSSFGQTDAVTGVWTPKKYTGTYGTNGFYLPFSDNTSATTLAYDKSGNGNNWTPNNISTTAGATYDSVTDVPTLTSATAANYCVLNPLDVSTGTLNDGNLKWQSTSSWQTKLSTFAIDSGKWYWEATLTSFASGLMIGVSQASVPSGHIGSIATGYGYYSGNKYNNNAATAYGATFATNDVIGVAFDRDAGTLTFYKNGTSQGTAYTGLTTGTYFMGVSSFSPDTLAVNFGQRPFSYTPPTGFKALNTFNLPDPTIKKPNQYMDATTYTGNGSTQTITNAAGFQPDLVWNKSRSVAASHELYDSVRGATNRICSNLTQAEDVVSGVTSFNSTGYSLGSGTGSNSNGNTFVGWQWKKGATPGFDIVTYTGNGTSQNISHSLGVAPSMMIVKSRTSGAEQWYVWHKSLGNDKYIYLSATNAVMTATTPWNNTAPTSTVFSVGSMNGTNQASNTFVNYLFAEIPQFSKFGSYTGNGSTDGPFLYLGFRPKYVMFKRRDSTSDWYILDTSRDTYNYTTKTLYADLSNAEGTGGPYMDYNSNGIKIRDAGAANNASGGTYIYAAFAENPFKYSLAR